MGSCEDGKFDLLGVVLHWRSREVAMKREIMMVDERGKTIQLWLVAGRPDAHASQIRSNVCDNAIDVSFVYENDIHAA